MIQVQMYKPSTKELIFNKFEIEKKTSMFYTLLYLDIVRGKKEI